MFKALKNLWLAVVLAAMGGALAQGHGAVLSSEARLTAMNEAYANLTYRSEAARNALRAEALLWLDYLPSDPALLRALSQGGSLLYVLQGAVLVYTQGGLEEQTVWEGQWLWMEEGASYRLVGLEGSAYVLLASEAAQRAR